MTCSGKFVVVWSTPGGPDFMHNVSDEGAESVSTFDTEDQATAIANEASAADVWPFTVVELA